MSYQEVAILLGCHGFDDFPVHHEGDAAESLLASWTALWHPYLIAASGKMPTWHRVDDPPAEREDRLWVVPLPYASELNPNVAQDLESKGGRLIRSALSRDQVLGPALEKLNGTDPEPALADDFLSLGYAYLQVELLTRQMRYSTTVDETAFEENVVAAARSAVEGNESATREKLQSCFDFLAQERDHYYAVDVFLIDITLLDPSLLGAPLETQLRSPTKMNLLLSGELAQELAATAPDSLQLLKKAIADQQATVFGGEYNELPLSLMSIETIRCQLRKGLDTLQGLLGVRPTVFGRRRFGLTPCLPQLLSKLGFRAALHATFDGGQFPEATQSKSRWEGDAQVSLDAILRAPLDATSATTFLNLASSISDSMDMDHVATRCFAHWAGQTSPWYVELQKICQYTHALGRFVTLDQYFDETYDPGMQEHFTADQYRSPRLAYQETDAISSCVRYWRRQLLIQSLVSCRGLLQMIDDKPETRTQFEQAQKLGERFALTALDESVWQAEEPLLRETLDDAGQDLVERLHPPTKGAAPGSLGVINPLGFPRRVAVLNAELPNCPAPSSTVYAVEDLGDRQAIVIDAPGMGIAAVGGAGGKAKAAKIPALAEDLTLRNEFLEASVDPVTGGLRTLHDYATRGNRLSQQLAFRFDRQGRYTKMVADGVEVVSSHRVLGEIQSRGKLIDEDHESIAEFTQTFRVVRGSRMLEVEVELHPHREPDADRWNSYFASRFAWSNEAADVERGLNEIRCRTAAQRFEAPLFIQIDDGKQRTSILTGGLPYHRKTGLRMLDSLLIVRGETLRKFRFGVGVELKQPFREAQALIAPEIVLRRLSTIPESKSSWLVHIDARHVRLIGWEPWLENDTVVGVRLRLCESEGRPGQVRITTFRSIQSARKTDFQGQTMTQCETNDDQLRFQISAHELTEIEARFQE